MGTLLQIVQDMCDETALNRPGIVFSSQDQDVRQLQALLQGLGTELVKAFEWRLLAAEYTFSTTGATDYALPSDFDRLVNDTEWDRTARWPGIGPDTAQTWAWLKGQQIASVPRFRFRLFGNRFYVYPTSVTGDTLSFEYQRNAWILDVDGATYKTRFTADTDTPLYDERLLVLGLKAKYLAAKGLDSSIAQQEFMERFGMVTAQDGGAPTLSLGPKYVSPLITLFNVPDGSWSV